MLPYLLLGAVIAVIALVAIVVLLIAILGAVKFGFNEVVTGLQAIHTELRTSSRSPAPGRAQEDQDV